MIPLKAFCNFLHDLYVSQTWCRLPILPGVYIFWTIFQYTLKVVQLYILTCRMNWESLKDLKGAVGWGRWVITHSDRNFLYYCFDPSVVCIKYLLVDQNWSLTPFPLQNKCLFPYRVSENTKTNGRGRTSPVCWGYILEFGAGISQALSRELAFLGARCPDLSLYVMIWESCEAFQFSFSLGTSVFSFLESLAKYELVAKKKNKVLMNYCNKGFDFARRAGKKLLLNISSPMKQCFNRISVERSNIYRHAKGVWP